jgi:hypothetical protein
MRRYSEEIERYSAIKRAAIAEGKTQPWTYHEAKNPSLVEVAERIAKDSDPQ